MNTGGTFNALSYGISTPYANIEALQGQQLSYNSNGKTYIPIVITGDTLDETQCIATIISVKLKDSEEVEEETTPASFPNFTQLLFNNVINLVENDPSNIRVILLGIPNYVTEGEYDIREIKFQLTYKSKNGMALYSIISLTQKGCKMPKTKYLYVEPMEDGEYKIMSYNTDVTTVYYSFDKETWDTLDSNAIVQINANTKCYLKGIKTSDTEAEYKINMHNYEDWSGDIGVPFKCGGDITSLINGIGGDCVLHKKEFYYMFNSCVGLTKAPELPAQTLAESCYEGMFSGCIGLTKAPELPAQTLAESCYEKMFSGCIGLTEAPELPAKTLANSCYKHMFFGCMGLTEAPELPAKTLFDYCYMYMFGYCTSLKYIKCDATNINAEKCCFGWLYNASHNGIFEKDENMIDWPIGDDGIPSSWLINRKSIDRTTEHIEMSIDKCITFKPQVINSVYNIGVFKHGICNPELYISDDKINWYKYTNYALKANTELYFIGNNTNGLSIDYDNYVSFYFNDANVLCNGNIMHLLDYTQDKTVIPNSCCFKDLFHGCTSLITAPELPAQTLAESCYTGMFHGCTNLVTAPELPAQTLAESCYTGMFSGCIGLETAPELPATTLVNSCYAWMLGGCKKITNIKCLATDISANDCTQGWVYMANENGTFIKHPDMTSWPTGESGIPSGWIIQDAILS